MECQHRQCDFVRHVFEYIPGGGWITVITTPDTRDVGAVSASVVHAYSRRMLK
jgi:predicted methyltransferase